MDVRVAVAMAVLVGAAPGCAEPAAPPRGGAAEALEVRCDGTSTQILTPIVQARQDGVHVLVHNVSSGDVLIGWDGAGDGAGPGDARFVFPILPGDARFRCQRDTPDADPGAPGGWRSFQVLEPAGWVSPELDCTSGKAYGSSIDYAPDAEGVSDPIADTRERQDAADAGYAGYATEDAVTVVTRDDAGSTATVNGYASDGRGGWLLTSTSGCSP